MRNDTYEEGQRWLAQAKEDLRWAKHLAEEAVTMVNDLLG